MMGDFWFAICFLFTGMICGGLLIGFIMLDAMKDDVKRGIMTLGSKTYKITEVRVEK